MLRILRGGSGIRTLAGAAAARSARLASVAWASVRSSRTGPRYLVFGGLGVALAGGWLPAVLGGPPGGGEIVTGGPGASIAVIDSELGERLARFALLPRASADEAALPKGLDVLPQPSRAASPPDSRVLTVAAFLRGRPLEVHAEAMVRAADEQGIDWRLMPVISVLESQAGLAACGGNAWGYASCHVRFGSFEEGIPVVAAALARYGNVSSETRLCIWVSGRGCTTRHAIDYLYRAAGLYARLGGSLALPALPPETGASRATPPPSSTVPAASPAVSSPTPASGLATPSTPADPASTAAPTPSPTDAGRSPTGPEATASAS